MTTCSPQPASPSKHQHKTKKTRQGYQEQGRVSSSSTKDTYNTDNQPGLQDKQYLSLSLQQENIRDKRSAETKAKEEVQTPSHFHSTTQTIPSHRPIARPHVDDHHSNKDDKVMLYITGYKKSKSDYEKQNHNDEAKFDDTINEIETEVHSGHYDGIPDETKQSSIPHSDKRHEKQNDSAINHSESEQESATSTQASKSSKVQENEEIKDQNTPSATDDKVTFNVGVGPIFVHEPETQNNTNQEVSRPDNTERNFRALIFPEDSTDTNSSDNRFSDKEKQAANPSIESSSEGTTSGKGSPTPSKESTSTPSRPIVFPEDVETKTESGPESPGEPTLTEAKTDVVLDVPDSVSMPVAAANPEVNVEKTERKNNTEVNNETDKGEKTVSNQPSKSIDTPTTESSLMDVVEGLSDAENTKTTLDSNKDNEGPNTNKSTPEASTLSPTTLDITSTNVPQKPSSNISTLPIVTTEKAKTKGTQVLIAQIFKSIFT